MSSDDGAGPARRQGRQNSRRKSRRVAFQVLFEIDCTGHSAAQAFTRLAEEPLEEEDLAFVREIVGGVVTNREKVDAVIRKLASAWPVEQIPPTERSILRLGIYEIMFKKSPPKVAINEAVELAKSFGTGNAPKFVNGVLGAFYAEFTDNLPSEDRWGE